MVGYGIVHYIIHPVTIVATNEQLKLAEGYHLQPLTWFLVLGAFSNGCVALTGTEAISNGIPAFKRIKNAATTLAWMAALLAAMFIGTSVMAYLYQVHPRESETVISQFARIIFTGGMGWFYYVIQGTTALILVLAANTSFADFPRLASLLARDRFLPRQFATRGDKLVFSNGIIILAVFAAVLVIGFGGDTSRLIPLYAVGVFLSFTLSQSGMVRHWMKAGRALKVTANDQSGDANAAALFGSGRRRLNRPNMEEIDPDKWSRRNCYVCRAHRARAHQILHGAWIVVVLIPLLVALFRAIHRHYLDVGRQLTTQGAQKFNQSITKLLCRFPAYIAGFYRRWNMQRRSRTGTLPPSTSTLTMKPRRSCARSGAAGSKELSWS
jgi:hypothetical protein